MTIPLFEKLKLFCIVVTLALGACGGGSSPSTPVVVVPPVPSVLRLELMDSRSQVAGTGPLSSHPYDRFTFLLNGIPIVVSSPAINTSKTYPDLRSAIEGAVNALKPTTPALANFTVTLGPNYTVFDPGSGLPVVGQSILLTDVSGGVIALNPIGGWLTLSGVVPVSGIYTRVFVITQTTSSSQPYKQEVLLALQWQHGTSQGRMPYLKPLTRTLVSTAYQST